MQIKDIFSKAQNSAEFKKWHAENADGYLTHLFFMDEGKGTDLYDVGYYSVKAKKMASFEVTDSGVCLKDFSEPYREPGKRVKKLDLEKVKITPEQAREAAKKLQEEKYPRSKPVKLIIILQNLEAGQVWNITYVTQQFETLNIKVDAETGKIVSDISQKIFEFSK
jgi:predicted RNA-binding protein